MKPQKFTTAKNDGFIKNTLSPQSAQRSQRKSFNLKTLNFASSAAILTFCEFVGA